MNGVEIWAIALDGCVLVEGVKYIQKRTQVMQNEFFNFLGINSVEFYVLTNNDFVSYIFVNIANSSFTDCSEIREYYSGVDWYPMVPGLLSYRDSEKDIIKELLS